MVEQSVIDLLLTGVEEANKKLDELMNWKAKFEERMNNRDKQIDDMRQTLYANSTGLVSTVQRLCNCKNDISHEISQWKVFFLGILQKLIVWGIIGLIVYLLYLYKTN